MSDFVRWAAGLFVRKKTARNQDKPIKDSDLRAWKVAVRDSDLYQVTLGLGEKDLVRMEELGRYIVVTLPDGQILLVVKNTCGFMYGEKWVRLLQARLPKDNLPGTGGGTAFIAVLSREDRELVLEAIERGSSRVERGHIWP